MNISKKKLYFPLEIRIYARPNYPPVVFIKESGSITAHRLFRANNLVTGDGWWDKALRFEGENAFVSLNDLRDFIRTQLDVLEPIRPGQQVSLDLPKEMIHDPGLFKKYRIELERIK